MPLTSAQCYAKPGYVIVLFSCRKCKLDKVPVEVRVCEAERCDIYVSVFEGQEWVGQEKPR